MSSLAIHTYTYEQQRKDKNEENAKQNEYGAMSGKNLTGACIRMALQY